MTAFLIVFLVLYGINWLLNVFYLARNDYPRLTEKEPWQDVLSLCISGGFIIWIAILLGG